VKYSPRCKFSSIITTPLLTSGLEEVTCLATILGWYVADKKAYSVYPDVQPYRSSPFVTKVHKICHTYKAP